MRLHLYIQLTVSWSLQMKIKLISFKYNLQLTAVNYWFLKHYIQLFTIIYQKPQYLNAFSLIIKDKLHKQR